MQRERAIEEEDKAKGKLGEQLVLNYLRERESITHGMRVRDCNDQNDTGVGRDFEIYLNGELTEVIEVKTTGSRLGVMKISDVQWAHALAHHLSPSKEKYWLYCVCISGTGAAQLTMIEDPVSAILDGRLDIDALYLRLGE